MRDTRTRLAGALAVSALLLATAHGPGPALADDPAAACAVPSAQDPRPHCCFTNPRYVGTCEVEPSKDETCAAILEYLNNPQSQGRAYCNRTNIRGDWKLVPCEPGMKQD